VIHLRQRRFAHQRAGRALQHPAVKDGSDSFTKAGEVAKNDDVDLNSSS
jgi:hypothetical protein